MCNCGKKRTEHQQQAKPIMTQSVTTTPTYNVNQTQNSQNTVFEYTGKTALTVIGNITGRRYRFNNPGDLQPVDYRDASGMMAVPVLRKR